MISVNNSLLFLENTTEKVVEDFSSFLPQGMENFSDVGESVSSLGLDRLLGEVVAILFGGKADVLVFFFTLLGLSLLMALSVNLSSDGSQFAARAVVLVSGGIIFSLMFPLVSEATKTLGELTSFFACVDGLCVSITALGGGVSTSSMRAVSSSFVLQLFGFLGSSLGALVAVMFIFAAISLIDQDAKNGIFDFIKNLFTRGVALLTACIGGFLTLQTVVASISDSAAIRTAKYAVSGLVPVVGGTVSSAISSLAGGLQYAVGVIGGGSVAVIVAMALSPVIMLLAYRGCLALAMFFLECCSAKLAARCISLISGVMDSLISVFVLTLIIYLYEILLFIIGGVAIA